MNHPKIKVSHPTPRLLTGSISETERRYVITRSMEASYSIVKMVKRERKRKRKKKSSVKREPTKI